MAAPNRTKAAPAAGLPGARFTEQRETQLRRGEQLFMEMLLEEQLRIELLQGGALRGKTAHGGAAEDVLLPLDVVPLEEGVPLVKKVLLEEEEEQPELGLLQEMQLLRGEQLVIKVPLEEQLRTELFQGGAACGKAAPGGAAKGEAAPGEAVRGAAAPEGAAHGGVDPGGAAEGEAAPGGAARGAPEGGGGGLTLF